jgi:hypothetical protein
LFFRNIEYSSSTPCFILFNIIYYRHIALVLERARDDPRTALSWTIEKCREVDPNSCPSIISSLCSQPNLRLSFNLLSHSFKYSDPSSIMLSPSIIVFFLVSIVFSNYTNAKMSFGHGNSPVSLRIYQTSD